MNSANQVVPWMHVLVGLGAVAAILVISWILADYTVKRQTRRHDTAENAAATIRLQIQATREEFRDKYMSVALRHLLEEAWQTYSALSQRSYYVDSAKALIRFEAEVAKTVEGIKRQVEVKPTAADFAADALALSEELAQAERTASAEEEQAKRDFDRAVGSINHTLDFERARIAKARLQLQDLESWLPECPDFVLTDACWQFVSTQISLQERYRRCSSGLIKNWQSMWLTVKITMPCATC